MTEPSVFVLGAQKCGTTTVADLLAAQPEIFVPSVKETYFFCDEELWARGVDWYRSEFYRPSATGEARIFCDATPFYLASAEAIDRLAGNSGADARFIVTLRDPVKRAYSAYWHQKRLGNEPLSFEDALDAEPGRVRAARAENGRWWRHAYVGVGRYASQLDHAFEVLGRDRILVLLPEDLEDVPALQERLREFVGLCPANGNGKSVSGLHSNSSAMPRSQALHRLVTGKNPLKSVVRTLVPREMRSRVGRKILAVNLKPGQYPPIDAAALDRLRRLFEPDIERLASMGLTGAITWKGAG
ncbi:sulfotransferase family protein [Amaricoccus tamworthensis]|uniref:sulfotransferase family protein n=1 Tax=Amaricoccus tamworthensis TaxID=57002 RepID=UPI003C7A0EC1